MIDALLFISVDSGLPPTNGEGPDGLGFFGLGDEVDAEFGLLNLGMGTTGDFNGNEVIDLEDIDILTEQSASGAHLLEYDLTGDGFVNEADVNKWAKDQEIGYPWIGDANYDGEFNTGDFVQVLGIGKYELPGATAVWSEGDWNGDGVFGTGDLVAALGDGGYELGPRSDVAAVPEPGSSLFALIAALGLWTGRRRRR
jgi:MYXO-CTERM domain-containing protein